MRRVVLAAALLAPAAIALAFILHFGVNVPMFDEWELIELEQHRRAGTLGFTELFSQHNEHRLLFPRLLMLTVSALTHFNSIALMTFGWVIAIGTASILFWEHLRTFGRSPRAWMLFLPVPWLVFTLAQWENWLWGWQVQIFLFAATFLAATALATYGTSKATAALGIACAVICTYSFASGASIWPVVIGILIVRRQKQTAIAFAAAALVSIAAYVPGYVPPSHHPSVTYALHRPMDGARYFLASLGSAFSNDPTGAQIFGALLIAALIAIALTAVRQRRAASVFLFPAALVAMAIGMGLLLTAGRSGAGVSQALSSRYVTVTVIGAVGLHRGALALEAGWAQRTLVGGLAALTVYGTVVSARDGLRTAEALHAARVAGAQALVEYRTRPDADLMQVDAKAELVRSRAPFLEANHLSVFADP